MSPHDIFKMDMTAARLAGDAEARLAMTPDKTLEELAEKFASEWYPSAQDEAARMFIVEPLVKFAGERVKEWRAAFHKYGRHLSDCHPHQGCNCGFTALSHSGKEGV